MAPAPVAPDIRLAKAMAGVMLACLVVIAGVTVAFAVTGYGRQALVGLVVTVGGAALLAALVWLIRHPPEKKIGKSLDEWARKHRSASIVLIVISVALAVVIRLLL
jgi:cobalamin synthase